MELLQYAPYTSSWVGEDSAGTHTASPLVNEFIAAFVEGCSAAGVPADKDGFSYVFISTIQSAVQKERKPGAAYRKINFQKRQLPE